LRPSEQKLLSGSRGLGPSCEAASVFRKEPTRFGATRGKVVRQEYLRIICGPESTAPEHLEGSAREVRAAKSDLALRELL
jgi:hypothetical protein